MEKSTITLTRRIQLLIDLPAYEQKEMWEKLYRYQNRCFRAANFIVSHLYVQEMIKDFFYLTEEIQYKLADVNKDEMGIFTRSKTHTTARMVFDRFKGEITTDILGSLNHTIQSTFSKNKADYIIIFIRRIFFLFTSNFFYLSTQKFIVFYPLKKMIS